MSYPRSIGPLRTILYAGGQPRGLLPKFAKDVPRKNEEEKSRDDEAPHCLRYFGVL
jgi:hypothetical protein